MISLYPDTSADRDLGPSPFLLIILGALMERGAALALFHRATFDLNLPYTPWPDFILDHTDQHSG